MANPKLARIRRFLPFLGIGLGAVGIFIWLVFYVQRGAHIRLEGGIQKVRTLALSDAASIAVIDFRFANPADYEFRVREVRVMLEEKGGRTLEGAVVSESDAQNLFAYYPVLGQKFNPSLTVKTRIRPRQILDRMLAVRFETTEDQVQQRRNLRIRVEDVDGAVSEIGEQTVSGKPLAGRSTANGSLMFSRRPLGLPARPV